MDKVGLNYDFENLTPEMFREFLRELQKSPYQWPNLYLAWEKEDGSLLMVGTMSTQFYHILKHELEPDKLPQLLELQKANGWSGEISYERQYVTGLRDIKPNVVHHRFVGVEKYAPADGVMRIEGPCEKYDPVEELVEQVSRCKYLGSWEDSDILMDNPYGYSRTLACGRWELAKEKIGITEKGVSLEDKLQDAESRSAGKEKVVSGKERDGSIEMV